MQKWLQNETGVCRTLRRNRDVAKCLRNINLKKNVTGFCRRTRTYPKKKIFFRISFPSSRSILGSDAQKYSNVSSLGKRFSITFFPCEKCLFVTRFLYDRDFLCDWHSVKTRPIDTTRRSVWKFGGSCTEEGKLSFLEMKIVLRH